MELTKKIAAFDILCVLLAFMLTILISCNPTIKTKSEKNDVHRPIKPVDLSHMIQLADTTFNGHKLSLWATDSLTNKFETLYLQMTNEDRSPATELSIDYQITMDMGMMTHGGPYYPLVNRGSGIYQADMVFLMANMKDMGQGWLFKTLLKEKGKTDTITFPLPVHEAPYARTITTGTKDDGRVFVSCLLPNIVKAGKQQIEFALHAMAKETFPVLDNYTVVIEPVMRGMKHTSSENKNAESQGNGRYTGTINFTMPGEWLIKVKLMKNDEIVSQDQLIYPITIN